MLAGALKHEARGEPEAARRLRAAARDAAPACPGMIDGERFAWIMDADERFGPVLEVIVEGQYRWLAIEHLQAIRAEPPRAMRDLVWQPVTLTLAAGQDLQAFVPVRYPGSEQDAADRIRLAGETRWVETAAGPRGLGQRLLSSDLGDHALLDLRMLRLDPSPVAAGA
jgi:type VI secretion system protein ImpE